MIKNFLKFISFIILMFNINIVLAGNIDHFIVEFNKDKAEVGEALDLTIKAVDKNDEIVKDYTGNILGLSQTDDAAQLPSDLVSDEGYTFKLSDQGVKKFENAVIFSQKGEQTISIYDSSDYENLTGEGVIKIVPRDEQKVTEEVTIITPENKSTLISRKTTISGKTKKNHQVQIEINGTKKISTISNSEGIFEKQVELDSGKNTIVAYVLDADDNIIGQSDDFLINVDDNKPRFEKLVLAPVSETGAVEEGTEIEAKVYGTKKLKSVKLLFNDGIVPLAETEDGIYTGNFTAPNIEGTYPIDVVLVDYLGHSTTIKDAKEITVYLTQKNSAPLPEPQTDTGTTNTCKGIKDKSLLTINGLKLVKLKTKSILTWNKNKYADSYDIYQKNKEGKFEFIKNTKEEKFEVEIVGKKIKYSYFAVRAKTQNGCNSEGKKIELKGDLSKATRIQTGPKELILMILISLIISFIILILRRKKV